MKFDNPIEYIDFNRNIGEKNYILIKTLQRLELIDLNTMTEVNSNHAAKQEWMGQGLQIADKTKAAREVHREVAGEGLLIRKMAEVGRCLLIVDAAGGVYLFREGELVDSGMLRISGVDGVGVSQSGRWLGVASREDRNIVIWELVCE